MDFYHMWICMNRKTVCQCDVGVDEHRLRLNSTFLGYYSQFCSIAG